MKYIALLAYNPIVEIFTYRQNRLQILKKKKSKDNSKIKISIMRSIIQLN